MAKVAKVLSIGKDGRMWIPQTAIELLQWRPKTKVQVEADSATRTITITEAQA